MASAGEYVTGTISGTGPAKKGGVDLLFQPIANQGFDVFLTGGGVMTIQAERSPDQGVTWSPIWELTAQTGVWTLNNSNVSQSFVEMVAGVIYRFNCTAWTSGTVTVGVIQ